MSHDKLELLNSIEIIISEVDGDALLYAHAAITPELCEKLAHLVSDVDAFLADYSDGQYVDIQAAGWNNGAKWYSDESGWLDYVPDRNAIDAVGIENVNRLAERGLSVVSTTGLDALSRLYAAFHDYKKCEAAFDECGHKDDADGQSVLLPYIQRYEDSMNAVLKELEEMAT